MYFWANLVKKSHYITMNDILDVFRHLLEQHRHLDIADSEFKKLIADDRDLRALYREWCDEQGYSEKNGFLEYGMEYLENENSCWETLADEDDEL